MILHIFPLKQKTFRHSIEKNKACKKLAQYYSILGVVI